MTTNATFKKFVMITAVLSLLALAAPGWSQDDYQPADDPAGGQTADSPEGSGGVNTLPPPPPQQLQPLSQEDELHLNTIGAFSAGFVLQSYGYIGVLADVLSQDVYSPELVRSMLAETINYLKNLNQQLNKYKNADIAAGDKKFIAQIQEIVVQLELEAEALSAFAQTRDKADLERFESARKSAWSKIRKTLGMN